MASRDEEAGRLYGLPMDEFTEARNARARELREAGDRKAAEAVRGLPKPTRAAWAANQLARRHPKEMEALLRAGERLRSAHEEMLAGGDGRPVSRAAADERAAVARLVERARELGVSQATLERVGETLHAAAGSEELRDELRRGAVARERKPAMFGGLAAQPAAAPRPRKGATKARPSKGAAKERKAAERERKAAERARAAERERNELLKAARAELRRLRSEHGKSVRALGAAGRRLDRARADLEELEREADSAREREQAAQRELSDAEQAVERLEG